MAQRSWTDQQLRDAVAASTTYRGVLRALKLKDGSYGHVQGCIINLRIDTSHFQAATQVLECSDDELRFLAASSSSSVEVLAKLGLDAHRTQFRRLADRLRILAIDTSHFSRERTRRGDRQRSWTDEQLSDPVAASLSIAQVIRALGLVHVQRRIGELALDTSHFRGRAWNRGLNVQPKAIPLSTVLVAGRWTTSHKLKLRLFREGLKEPKCELCGWCELAPDGRIPVELDHINGDKNDNRLENLRILCPNCHSLQPTHRGLNQRRHRAVALVGFEPTLEPF